MYDNDEIDIDSLPEERIIELRQIMLSRYKQDAAFFAMHALGTYIHRKQLEIYDSISKGKYTLVHACHGASKTFTGAVATVWFYNTRLDSFIFTTAPTYRQVRELLWREISCIYENQTKGNKAILIGENLQTRLQEQGNAAHVAIGFSTDTNRQSGVKAEGAHGYNLFIVFDEAKGIPEEIYNAGMGAIGSPNSKLLIMSTTDGVVPGSTFFNIVKHKEKYPKWNVIHIDCFDLPAFTGEKLIGIEWTHPTGLTFRTVEKSIEELQIDIKTPEWEFDVRTAWGEDSILYKTKARGFVVDNDPLSMVPLHLINNAYKKYQEYIGGRLKYNDLCGIRVVGADIADEGDDFTVVYVRDGNIVKRFKRMGKIGIVASAELIAEAGGYDKENVEYRIDDTGLGGVAGILKSWGYKKVIGINFASKPRRNPAKLKDKQRYPNIITQAWYYCKDIINEFAIEENENLTSELTGRKSAGIDTKGRALIESKADFKKRLGRSCDDADAFILTIFDLVKYEPVAVA